MARPDIEALMIGSPKAALSALASGIDVNSAMEMFSRIFR
jgi:hypothetical protein